MGGPPNTGATEQANAQRNADQYADQGFAFLGRVLAVPHCAKFNLKIGQPTSPLPALARVILQRSTAGAHQCVATRQAQGHGSAAGVTTLVAYRSGSGHEALLSRFAQTQLVMPQQ